MCVFMVFFIKYVFIPFKIECRRPVVKFYCLTGWHMDELKLKGMGFLVRLRTPKSTFSHFYGAVATALHSCTPGKRVYVCVCFSLFKNGCFDAFGDDGSLQAVRCLSTMLDRKQA